MPSISNSMPSLSLRKTNNTAPKYHSDPVKFPLREYSSQSLRNSDPNDQIPRKNFSQKMDAFVMTQSDCLLRNKRNASSGVTNQNQALFQQQKEAAVVAFTGYLQRMQGLLTASEFSTEQRALLDPAVTEVIRAARDTIRNLGGVSSEAQLLERLMSEVGAIDQTLARVWKIILTPLLFFFERQAHKINERLKQFKDDLKNGGLGNQLSDEHKSGIVNYLRRTIADAEEHKNAEFGSLPETTANRFKMALQERQRLISQSVGELAQAQWNRDAIRILKILERTLTQHISPLRTFLSSPQRTLCQRIVHRLIAEIVEVVLRLTNQTAEDLHRDDVESSSA